MMEPAHKRLKLSPKDTQATQASNGGAEESTDFKLAILSSLRPDRSQDVLLDYLLAYEGSVDAAVSALSGNTELSPRKRNAANGYQSSLASFTTSKHPGHGRSTAAKHLTKKGRTLHLYVSFIDLVALDVKLTNAVTRRH